MDQLRKLFSSLSIRQRLTMAAVAILVIAGIVAFLKWNRNQDFKPLYASLSAEDAGAVVAKLRENGIEYHLREADSTILIPSAKVAEMRLQMATAGIPKSGRIGYELFDKTNLGMTDFTEQVNYHRAIEGELERSVLAMNGVEQVRVHISFPKESVFSENRQAAKASVMIKLRTGLILSEPNAAAVTQLVSSAVEGLIPESVSVMDMKGNLLIRPKKPGDGSEPSDDLLRYKARLEREVIAKVASVLDPLLGSEKYRASADVDCDLTSGEQSEETFDPNHSVITSSQRTEEGTVSHDTASGSPGTASNLPRPSPRPVAAAGGGVAKRTESTAFETSRTVRRVRLPQGIVRRISLSVLVDQNLRWEMVGKGQAAKPQRIIEAPSPDRMKSIQAVVSAAAGISATRGDQLTVETLPFEATLTSDPPAYLLPMPVNHPAPPAKFSPVMIGGAAGGVALLVIVVVVLARSKKKASAQKAQLQAELEAAKVQPVSIVNSEVTVADKITEAAPLPNLDHRLKPVFETPDAFRLPPIITTKGEVLTKQVAEEARKDPAALAQIIRTWLNESGRA